MVTGVTWSVSNFYRSCFGILVLLSCLFCGCKHLPKEPSPSDIKITQGIAESGFPYVVKITITRTDSSKGNCTASFLSDSLAITAAHCLSGARMVHYGNVQVTSENVFVHPNWKVGPNGTVARESIRNDLALIRFPAQTYQGAEYARMSQTLPGVNDTVKIIGFGFNESKGLQKYCYLPIKRLESTQKCGLQLATLQSDGTYNVTTIFSFNPTSENSTDPDAAECTGFYLNHNLALQEFSSIEQIKSKKCGGHIGPNRFTGSGSGEKRSGMNSVFAMEDGAISLVGSPSGEPTGVNSAGAQGDSGGPLLIQEGDQWVLAGIASSGRTLEENSRLVQRTHYKSIHEDDTITWFKTIVPEQNLNFPQINSMILSP